MSVIGNATTIFVQVLYNCKKDDDFHSIHFVFSLMQNKARESEKSSFLYVIKCIVCKTLAKKICTAAFVACMINKNMSGLLKNEIVIDNKESTAEIDEKIQTFLILPRLFKLLLFRKIESITYIHIHIQYKLYAVQLYFESRKIPQAVKSTKQIIDKSRSLKNIFFK